MNLFPMLLFITIMTVTPGPNNMILTTSGTMFGYRKSSPFIIGVTIGLITQLLLTAAGLGLLFTRYPILEKILKISGFTYISWLAIKISLAKNSFTESGATNPPGMLKGFIFQYLNPKAYLMSITTISLYSLKGDHYIWSVATIIFAYLCITPLSTSLWALFGAIIKRVIVGKNCRWIQWILGGLTLFSAVSLLH